MSSARHPFGGGHEIPQEAKVIDVHAFAPVFADSIS
jgi:hypothetical protein